MYAGGIGEGQLQKGHRVEIGIVRVAARLAMQASADVLRVQREFALRLNKVRFVAKNVGHQYFVSLQLYMC
jgi:hypothetical protein